MGNNGSGFRYNGGRYRFYGGEWVDENYTSVSTELAQRLGDRFGGFLEAGRKNINKAVQGKKEVCRKRGEILYQNLILREFVDLDKTTPGEVVNLLKKRKYRRILENYNGGNRSNGNGIYYKVNADMLRKANDMGMEIDFKEVYLEKLREDGHPLKKRHRAKMRKVIVKREKMYKKNPELRKKRVQAAINNLKLAKEKKQKELNERAMALFEEVIKPRFGEVEFMEKGDTAKLVEIIPEEHGDFYEKHYKGMSLRCAVYRDVNRLRKLKSRELVEGV